MEDAMFTINPWSLVIRGIVAVIFGLLLTMWPGVTLEVLVLLFAFFAIIDGIIIIIMALVRGRKEQRWEQLLPLGIVGIILGAIILLIPGISILILIYLIAAWALITGFGEFVYGLASKGISSGMRWLYAFGGIISVILGILIFVYPISTTAVLLWILGFFLLIWGIYAIISGFWMRSVNKKIGPSAPATP